MEIFNKSHITIASESKNIEEAFNEIAKKAKTLKLITDEKILIQDLMKREKMVSTGVGNNVSIPHAVSSSIIKPGIIFLRFKKPIPWKSIDKKPVKVAIALLIPEKERNDLHMNYLTSIAQGLLDSKFVSTLINEKSKDKLAEAILNHLTNHSNDKDNTQPQKDMVLAITACPTGVAHTFMSAKALEDEAKKRKIVFKAQKNGSQGVVDTLTDEEIKKAKYIILANDIEIDTTRLVGKKIYQTSAKKALHNPADVFNKAEKEATILQTRTNAESFFKGKMNVYKHILTGISFMLPFVVAGGILTAVSFFWGIWSFDPTSPQYNPFAASLKTIGAAGMGLMIPALAGYIAYSIGDRPALVPGFIGGFLANNGFDGLKNTIDGNDTNFTSGFLGAILAGLVAGYLIQILRLCTKRIPEKFSATKPMLIYPLVGTIVTGLLVIWVFNIPVGYLQHYINLGLNSIGDNNPSAIATACALGTILGVLIATDFGGPFNKIAYLFGVADLATHALIGQKSIIMAAVSASCIMPPLATSLAVLVFPTKFDQEAKSAGYVNFLLGATHITEGTIPFVAKRPQINIPVMMVGSVITCILSLVFGCATAAPHGGFLVIALVDRWYLWLLAILVGVVVSGLLFGIVTQKPYQVTKIKYSKIYRTDLKLFLSENQKLSKPELADKLHQFKLDEKNKFVHLKQQYKKDMLESRNKFQLSEFQKALVNNEQWLKQANIKLENRREKELQKNKKQPEIIESWFNQKTNNTQDKYTNKINNIHHKENQWSTKYQQLSSTLESN